MEFWVFMLIMSILLPVAFIIFGKIFLNGAPEEINGLFGYRTPMSRKNEDTWAFAHKFVGKLWFVSGLALLPISVIPIIFVIGKTDNIVGIVGGVVEGCQILFIIASIICTEIALRKHFDKNGNRL